MLHIVKLCVGASSIDDLAAHQNKRRAAQRASGKPERIVHRTLQTPRRQQELAGGSLYWVIKGMITARQEIIELAEAHREDGTPCCEIVLNPAIIPVCPAPRRAFQGWRYLPNEDAPLDRAVWDLKGHAACPPAMLKELTELCLI